MSKKLSILFILMVFGVFVLAFSVKATLPPPQSTSIDNPLNANDFTTLLKDIIKWVVRIGELVAVVMIIYSGLLFMTSGGIEEKVTKARKSLTWSLIGLAVLLIGEGWIYILKDLLGTK